MYLEKKKGNKKIIISSIIVSIVLIGVVGVTYALWSYSKVGPNQELVAGNIYMKYTETDKTITIEDAMPREEYIPDKYFEFTVEGANTYKKDIWYEILLSEGDAPDPETKRTERIRPDLLLFKLVEVENGEETVIFDRMSYPELDNTSVWVDTIKGGENNVLKTYRLYMWVSPLTKLGNGDDIDYDTETWNNKLYGSVKVSVNGDFNEKEAFSCFAPILIATYNDQRTDEQLNACANYLSEEWESDVDFAKEFCAGTVAFYESTIQDYLEEGIFTTYELQKLAETGVLKDLKSDYSTIENYLEECPKDVVIPSYMNKSKITSIGYRAFRKNQLTSINIPNSVTTIGESAFYQNQLTSVNIPDSVTTIESGAFSNNQLTSVNIPNSVTTIGGLDCIDSRCSGGVGAGAFEDNQLTSVNIPDSVTTIGAKAFYDNQLTSVTIPNSVTTIGANAFMSNQLTSVTIGNGIKYIGIFAFEKNTSSAIGNHNLSSITIDKTCEEIKNIEASSEYTTKYYPWLSFSSPYTAPGVTIYGSGGEVCDTFE